MRASAVFSLLFKVADKSFKVADRAFHDTRGGDGGICGEVLQKSGGPRGRGQRGDAHQAQNV